MCAKWASFFEKDEGEDPDPVCAGDPARPDEEPGTPLAKAETKSREGAGTEAEEGPWTVSDLLARVKRAMRAAFAGRVQVVGEISNFTLHSSGHMYFRLKDERTAIDAAMWRQRASRLKFTPTDGLEVVAEGRVDVYEARGQLQLYVERLTPKGEGALELAFRQLREKLQAEGLFDSARKKPPPRFPRAIGVITSPTGAAIRDIRRTLARRWPAARVFLVPVAVQGEGAAEEVARAIGLLDAAAAQRGVDTIIIGRGGGSLEDLWAFNEEAVARAILAAATPIISGVGHEGDVSIADLVADVRAATPTAAAELAVPDRGEVSRQMAELGGRMARAVDEYLRAGRLGLESVQRSVVFRDPLYRLRGEAQRVDELWLRLRAGLREQSRRANGRLEPLVGRLAGLHPALLHERALGRLREAMHRLAWALGRRSKRAGDRLARALAGLGAAHPGGRLRLARQQIAAAERQLEAMSYRSVLRRGYTLTRDGTGRIVRSASKPTIGDSIWTELVDGQIGSRVTETAAGQTARPAPPPPARPRRRKDRGPTLFDTTDPEP